MTDSSDPARTYARIRYRLLLAELLAGVLVLLLVQASGVSRAWAACLHQRTAFEPLVICWYLAGFGTVYYLAMLPLHFYGSFIVEHRFQLSRMSRRDWWVREAKRVGVSSLISLLLVEALYALLRHEPAHWPVWATIGWVVFSAVLARLFPTVLLPFFYKTTPVDDPALVERLLMLCRRVGVKAFGVFRFQLGAETRKANAALAGLGTTRRVLLSDTLINAFTHEEIEGVLAHELAHHHYRHILKMLALSAAGSWMAFQLTQAVGPWWVQRLGLESLADIAGFPALMLWLSLLGLLGLPLQNGISRAFEWQADRFATRTATVPEAFAEALRRLGALNLADPHPPRWVVWLFYDHPPITERIQAATPP